MRCICYNNAVETVDVESVPPSSSDAAQRRERWLRRESSAMIKDFEKRMSGHSIDHFVHEEAIFSMLEPMSRSNELAPCALLDGEWLLNRAALLQQCSSRDERRKLALPRRQDLERDEPQAYMKVSTLRKLKRGDERINSPLRLVCVSHIWHGVSHPDPFGDNLLVLADALIKARAVERFPTGDFAVFLDWVSLHQRDANGKRTPKEQAAFRQALSQMNIWYAHQKTLVYLLTQTPPEWPVATVPYQRRGWPSFERMISMILKHQSRQAWATICDVGAFAPGGPQRTVLEPPRDAEGFSELLEQLHFTNGADKEMVLALYRDTLNSALGQTRSLRFAGLRWGDAEMATLAKVLPLCRNLEYLNLKGSHNGYTAESATVLADVLSREPKVLPNLVMIGAGCRAKDDEAGQGPLLESEQLKRACESRGVELLRDVPFELVQRRYMPSWEPHSRDSTRQRRRSSVYISLSDFRTSKLGGSQNALRRSASTDRTDESISQTS